MSPHPVNPRQPKGGNRDGRQYDAGWRDGRRARHSHGCLPGLVVIAALIAIAIIATRVSS